MTEIACVVEAHDALGECCLWCPATRRLWWLDIRKPCLQSYDPLSREHRVYPLPGQNCGCAALRASGGLVPAMAPASTPRASSGTPSTAAVG